MTLLGKGGTCAKIDIIFQARQNRQQTRVFFIPPRRLGSPAIMTRDPTVCAFDFTPCDCPKVLVCKGVVKIVDNLESMT